MNIKEQKEKLFKQIEDLKNEIIKLESQEASHNAEEIIEQDYLNKNYHWRICNGSDPDDKFLEMTEKSNASHSCNFITGLYPHDDCICKIMDIEFKISMYDGTLFIRLLNKKYDLMELVKILHLKIENHYHNSQIEEYKENIRDYQKRIEKRNKELEKIQNELL